MLFGAMNALGLETRLAADQGVVCVVVGTVVGAGGARLEVGVSYPMGLEDPSHRREQPLAPGSTPNEPGLITSRLLLSVLCLRWSGKLE